MSATAKTWVNNQAPTCEDADLNGFKNENNNLIVGSAQALSTGDNQQTHKAVSVYAAGGDFYSDTGSADTYVLNVVGSRLSPPAYFTGMRVRFLVNADNTGASTVNVAGLGVKAITYPFASALIAAALTANVVVLLEYDGTQFVLNDISSLLTAADYATARTYPPTELPPGTRVEITDDDKNGTFVRKSGSNTDDDGTILQLAADSNEFLERQYEGAVEVPWFAVADGVADDTAAITAAGAVVQAAGGGALEFFDRSYSIRDDSGAIPTGTEDYRAIIDFVGIDVEIRANKAKLILRRDYLQPERDIVFRFQGCNPKIGTFVCTYTGTRDSQPESGGVLCLFRVKNRTIEMDDQHVTDWSMGVWDRPSNNTDEFTNHWSGKPFTIYGLNTGYPYIADNGSTGLHIYVDADTCTRSCTLQDARRAKVYVNSRNHQASNDCGLSGTLQDIDFTYVNTTSTKAAQDDCVSLQYPSEFNTDVGPWDNAHDGAGGAAVLTDTAQSWGVNALIGYRVYNDDDFSSAIITSNTATTITGVLSGGYENDWDIGDRFHVGEINGSHDGSSGAATLTDSTAAWPAGAFVGQTLRNRTDKSFGVVTANTSTTITAVLENGTDDDWDAGDVYEVGESHRATNVKLSSHVETFDGAFLGKPLFVGLGVSAIEDDRDPGYIMRYLNLTLILRTDNASQESLVVQDVLPFSSGKNISKLRVAALIEGGLSPQIDLDMLIDSAAFDNVVSDKKLQISNADIGKVTITGGKFPASSANTGDTSNITLIGCDIADNTSQSVINKAFVDCLLNGESYNRDSSVGTLSFSAVSSIVVNDSRVTAQTFPIVIPADNAAGTIQGSSDHIITKSRVVGTSITIGSASGNSISGTFRFELKEFG